MFQKLNQMVFFFAPGQYFYLPWIVYSETLSLSQNQLLILYFQRHDGDAATIEDWLQVFEDSTGRDLSQFKNWYTQAGTPEVSVTETYAEGEFQLTFSQKTPATPGQIEKDPKVIPIALGLLSPCGQELLPTQILELNQPQQSFTFASSKRPIASILREFSAPILLKHTQNDATKAFLLAHDPDPFNKWQAARTLAVESLKELAQHNQAPALEFLDALQAVASGAPSVGIKVGKNLNLMMGWDETLGLSGLQALFP